MDPLEGNKLVQNVWKFGTLASTTGEFQHAKYSNPSFLNVFKASNKHGFGRAGHI